VHPQKVEVDPAPVEYGEMVAVVRVIVEECVHVMPAFYQFFRQAEQLDRSASAEIALDNDLEDSQRSAQMSYPVV